MGKSNRKGRRGKWGVKKIREGKKGIETIVSPYPTKYLWVPAQFEMLEV